ncbi:MAG: Tex-like N-terminal domain-containing protein, partial [Dokdonella sp.]
MQSIEQRIAADISAQTAQVKAAVDLLDGGATVPFIARYRKEVTGGLDDIQLRLLEERLGYLRELEDRRGAILESIAEQGKLDDALKAQILTADTKARLEDLYLPYKQKRRTKAQIAREAGLELLALALREDPTIAPEARAAEFVDGAKGVSDVKAALDGARQILMESIAEDAALLGGLRDWIWNKGQIRAKVIEGKENEGAKFRDYFDHAEAIAKIPSHRLLALMRARNEGVLALELSPTAELEQGHIEAQERVAAHAGIAARGRAADAWLIETCRLTWRVKLHLSLMLDLFA